MALDPQIAQMLEFIEAAGYPPMSEGDPETARAGFRALTVGLRKAEDRIEVGEVVDGSLPGPTGEMSIRIYRPAGDGPWPTTVYFHGGGFVIGDLDTCDATCRRLVRDAHTAVVSVAYRLAPEHRFPAAVDDAVAATEFVADRLDGFGGLGVLGVAGDSAGGNLAAVVAQRLPGRVDAQLLVYPSTDVATERPSRTQNALGYFLDQPTMEWFFGHYMSGVGEVAPDDPRHSPLYAVSHGAQLPPAVIATAEFDPLRDEGEAYAQALSDSGVEVALMRYDGLIHGFVDMTQMSAAADAAVMDLVTRYAALLARLIDAAQPHREDA